jgi:hypothetical protein
MLAPAALLRRNSYEVESMATAADKGQLLVLRNLLMQYCMVPMFAVMDTCDDASFTNYHRLCAQMRTSSERTTSHCTWAALALRALLTSVSRWAACGHL